MTPDLNITKAFLSLIDPDGIFTFQTFSDSNEKSSMLNCVRHGTLDEHHVELTRLQKLDASRHLVSTLLSRNAMHKGGV
jgi:hypothetical protein